MYKERNIQNFHKCEDENGVYVSVSHSLCNTLKKKIKRRGIYLGIINRYSSLAYPQSNGQAKATNKTIVNGLKKRRRSGKRKLGRGIAECFMGLLDHIEEVNG